MVLGALQKLDQILKQKISLIFVDDSSILSCPRKSCSRTTFPVSDRGESVCLSENIHLRSSGIRTLLAKTENQNGDSSVTFSGAVTAHLVIKDKHERQISHKSLRAEFFIF